jgi:hypothetical protein
MKRLLAPILCSLALTACHLGEPLLPAPNADRDPRLLGEWHNPEEPGATLKITAVGERGYRFDYDAGPEAGKERGFGAPKMTFVGYHTDLPGGIRLLCLELKDPSPKDLELQPWLPVGYDAKPDGTVVFRLIDHRAMPPGADGEHPYAKVPGRKIWDHLAQRAASAEGRARLFDSDGDLGPLHRKRAP